MNDLYRLENKQVENVFSFDEEVLKKALKNIYGKEFHPMTDIEENLFEATWKTMNNATDKGFGTRKADDPDYDFYREIRANNAVFAAFKVHRAQNDMAALLLDENGNLRPFEQWLKLVMPIANHQMVHWLRTEYDTAVIRAHQAADWRQFEREKDILPNLKWMPSTSVHPGADHRVFWGTIRPVDDPFWNEHRPGDRWNCKCTLSSTDEAPTAVPGSGPDNKPQPGLENNPGKDAKLFSDKHPYQKDAHRGAKKTVDKLTLEEKEAIARHNLQMEKTLGITKGKPMTVEEADKQNANPKHKEQFIPDPQGLYQDKQGNKFSKNPDFKPADRQYGINCQTCAPAYALRLKGFDITAKGNTPGSKLDYLSRGTNAWEVWKNIDGTQAKHTSITGWMASKQYILNSATL